MTAAPATPYEARLRTDWEWKMDQADAHFRGGGTVREALMEIAGRLGDLGLPYAVCGGMAVVRYGPNRFTDDVDLLMTREDREAAHAALRGRGYLPLFAGSKNLRDTRRGVRIEFLTTGGYPGDGKPGPVAFPHPADVAAEFRGISFLSLPALVELKLASGLTAPDRPKDFGDVVELIRANDLREDFAGGLNPHVRPKFEELRAAVEAARRRDDR